MILSSLTLFLTGGIKSQVWGVKIEAATLWLFINIPKHQFKCIKQIQPTNSYTKVNDGKSCEVRLQNLIIFIPKNARISNIAIFKRMYNAIQWGHSSCPCFGHINVVQHTAEKDCNDFPIILQPWKLVFSVQPWKLVFSV